MKAQAHQQASNKDERRRTSARRTADLLQTQGHPAEGVAIRLLGASKPEQNFRPWAKNLENLNRQAHATGANSYNEVADRQPLPVSR